MNDSVTLEESIADEAAETAEKVAKIGKIDRDDSNDKANRRQRRQARAAAQARELMLREYQGVLSTLSVDEPGYPFGSVVPFCVDRNGQPVILISRIAQHTKNIEADAKVSLIVSERDSEDSQASGRVTYLGSAHKIDANDTDTAERYYRFFPEAKDHHKAHDFDLFRIELHRVRFIGGFGQIFWIEKDQFQKANPFNHQQEYGAVDHMNEDHLDAMAHYCKLFNLPVLQGEQALMAGVDADGFHLRIGKRIHRLAFDEPVATPHEMRMQLIALARREAA